MARLRWGFLQIFLEKRLTAAARRTHNRRVGGPAPANPPQWATVSPTLTNARRNTTPASLSAMKRPFTLHTAVAAIVTGIALGIVSDRVFADGTYEANTDRLFHVFAKARRGEPITVGVIGGSITAGAMASATEKNYASLVTQWWRQTFPKSNIRLVNAGIGADQFQLTEPCGPSATCCNRSPIS